MDANVRIWLPRALVESALIVGSILLALALDEWQEDQEIEELIDRSIVNFVNELNQNRSRIEDVSAYHNGVWQVLERWNGSEESASRLEFRNIMDAMQPVVLTSSAWQTAVATGALRVLSKQSLTRMPEKLLIAILGVFLVSLMESEIWPFWKHTVRAKK